MRSKTDGLRTEQIVQRCTQELGTGAQALSLLFARFGYDVDCDETVHQMLLRTHAITKQLSNVNEPSEIENCHFVTFFRLRSSPL